jgi:hypothetical protein
MMRTARNLTSALLGLAMLAVPLTAAAQAYDSNSNRDEVPIYQEAAATQPGLVLVHDDWREHHRFEHRWHHDRDDWRWRDRDDWRYRRRYNRYTYNHYRTICDHDGDDCRQVPWFYR